MRHRSGFPLTLTISAVLCFLSLPARARQIAYEGFSPSFPVYAGGGAGFSQPWTRGGFNAFASGYSPMQNSLSFGCLQVSRGSISGPTAFAINGAVRTLQQPLGQDHTTVYLSFLLRPHRRLNNGIFGGFFGLTLNGSLGNDLFVGKAPEEYVIETRGGSGQLSSGVPTDVGRTALLVVRAEFLPGRDAFTLYVNPSLQAPEPASGIVKTDLDLGLVTRVGIYSTGAFAIDEIRIGTTYADVLPTRNAEEGDSEACREKDDSTSARRPSDDR